MEHIGPLERRTPTPEQTMTILQELITLIDGLDVDGQDYQNVKTIKRLAHNLQKIAENLGQETA